VAFCVLSAQTSLIHSGKRDFSGNPLQDRLFSQQERNSRIDTIHKINEQIRISPIRVVDDEGEMLGVMPTSEALTRAIESGMDLVEVAPGASPPVCRIMDYGKFKYEQKKKQSKNDKQHQIQVKEVRLRPKTGAHDIEFKLKRARKFLEGKDKVKVTVLFRGRENAHHDRGHEMLVEFMHKLEDIAKAEKLPGMDNPRQMSLILAPR
jgi:translation initiation factor IF-3